MSAGFWLRLASILGFLAVAIGAFGAHGLRARLYREGEQETAVWAKGMVSPERRLEVFETGVRYHFLHALAMLGLAAWVARTGSSDPWADVAGWSFLVGIVVFSGSLYALGLTGLSWLGAITPLGGLALLAGWAALACAAGGAAAPPGVDITP